MGDFAIGDFVRKNLEQLFVYCEEVDPEELTKLADKDYSKNVLNLNFAFLRSPAEIKADDQHTRYWTEMHHVLDRDVRVTSQWYVDKKQQLGHFLAYLLDKGLTPVGITPEAVDAALDALDAQDAPVPSKAKSTGGARFKKTAIGVSQNAVVRHVLGSLPEESFTLKDWLAVKRTFGHRCVYCSSGRQIVMDHAVPISIAELGEHRLGNLVAACHDCNTVKGDKRYDVYLRSAQDLPDPEGRIATIEAHMAQHDYAPMADVLTGEAAEEVRETLKQLRAQVANAATATIAALNDSRQRGSLR